jgi:hypothetical protein
MSDNDKLVLLITDAEVEAPRDLPKSGTIESLKETHPEFYAQIQEVFRLGAEELKRRAETSK